MRLSYMRSDALLQASGGACRVAVGGRRPGVNGGLPPLQADCPNLAPKERSNRDAHFCTWAAGSALLAAASLPAGESPREENDLSSHRSGTDAPSCRGRASDRVAPVVPVPDKPPESDGSHPAFSLSCGRV